MPDLGDEEQCSHRPGEKRKENCGKKISRNGGGTEASGSLRELNRPGWFFMQKVFKFPSRLVEMNKLLDFYFCVHLDHGPTEIR